jgi:hypothetical protein
VIVIATGGGKTDVTRTDASGRASLSVAGVRIEQLKVQTDTTHWGAYRSNLPIIQNGVIKLRIDRVSRPFKDAVAHFYGASQFDPKAGVVVGVIDTGVGPHADLNLVGGRNASLVELPGQFDDWRGHGTHVAGLVGASPSPKGGVRGLAPGVAIRSYRVFPKGGGATNWAVMRAILFAEVDDCDILNLSLGLAAADPLVERAIRDARDRGILVIAAAGNHRRGPVTHPAACPDAIGVSALGVVGCFPPGSFCAGEEIRPPVRIHP